MRAAALLAWRNLSSRPLRTLLTAGGVVLGVSLVLSVLISTRSLDAEMRAVFAGDQGEAAFRVSPTGPRPLSRDLEAIIRGVPGVKQAIPQFVGGGIALAFDGTITSVPFFVVDPAVERDLHTYQLVEGSFPGENGEQGVVLEEAWAKSQGLRVGDPVTLSISPQMQFDWKVTGLISTRGIGSYNGGEVALLDLSQYQAATNRPGAVGRFLITLTPDARASQVLEELKQALPEDVAVMEAGYGGSQDGGFKMGLGFFAGIAILVGAYLIFGAFSLSLRQRVVQTGMMMAVGATGSQVAGSLLLEAGGVGLAGSLLGLPLGAALSFGMVRLVGAATGRRQISAYEVAASDFVFALGLGVLVAVAAALLPAWRASRLSPVEAVRNTQEAGNKPRVLLALIGLGLAGVGLVSWTYTISKGQVMLAQAFTAVYFLGVTLAIPLLVRWGVLYLLQPASRRLGAVALLAAGNLVRNIERATLTVAAMMVAVAMLISYSAVNASFWQGAENHIASAMAGDLVLWGDVNEHVARAVREVPGVAALSTEGETFLRGKNCTGENCSTWSLNAMAIDPTEVRKVLPFNLTAGDREAALKALEEGGALVLSTTHARKYGIRLGDTITTYAVDLRGQAITDKPAQLKVVGLINVAFNQGRIGYISQSDAQRYFGGTYVTRGYVKLAPGADPAGVAPGIQAVASRLQVRDFSTFREKLRADVLGQLGAFKAILYIALFASALGIINTLALSVVERRRELALLRAVGATGGQNAYMIVVESLFLGLVGAALGVLAGSLFAGSFVRGAELYMNFVAPFTYPTTDAILAAALALGLAVIAAVVPAWRAGRVEVVTGLRTE